jgi:hypothetical protein
VFCDVKPWSFVDAHRNSGEGATIFSISRVEEWAKQKSAEKQAARHLLLMFDPEDGSYIFLRSSVDYYRTIRRYNLHGSSTSSRKPIQEPQTQRETRTVRNFTASHTEDMEMIQRRLLWTAKYCFTNDSRATAIRQQIQSLLCADVTKLSNTSASRENQ